MMCWVKKNKNKTLRNLRKCVAETVEKRPSWTPSCFPWHQLFPLILLFLLVFIPPLALYLLSHGPNLQTVSLTDHEAKVSLSVVSVPAAQVSLQCQWAQIPSRWLCQCQSAGKRTHLTALIKQKLLWGNFFFLF